MIRTRNERERIIVPHVLAVVEKGVWHVVRRHMTTCI